MIKSNDKIQGTKSQSTGPGTTEAKVWKDKSIKMVIVIINERRKGNH